MKTEDTVWLEHVPNMCDALYSINVQTDDRQTGRQADKGWPIFFTLKKTKHSEFVGICSQTSSLTTALNCVVAVRKQPETRCK